MEEAEYWLRLETHVTRRAFCDQRNSYEPYLHSQAVPRGVPRPLKCVSVQVTGHDQGWVDDRASGSYSFYVLGKMAAGGAEILRGPIVFFNAVGNGNWQVRVSTLVAELILHNVPLADGSRPCRSTKLTYSRMQAQRMKWSVGQRILRPTT